MNGMENWLVAHRAGLPAPKTLRMEEAAWAWADLVERRRLPALALSTAVFVLLFGSSALIALAFGELNDFLADPRWPATYFVVAANALHLAKFPAALDAMWGTIRPWLANEAEMGKLEAESRAVLARFFLPSMGVWSAFVAYWALTNEWGERFASPFLAPALHLMYGLPLIYFAGAMAAINSAGLLTLLTRIARTARFERGLMLEGGHGVIRPLRNLLWRCWLFFVVVFTATAVASTPVTGTGLRDEDFVLWVVILALTFGLVLGQMAMNRVFERERANEIGRLRAELRSVNAVSEPLETNDLLLRLLRAEALRYDLSRVEALHTGLLDLRFLVQVSLSATAIAIANLLLRFVVFG